MLLKLKNTLTRHKDVCIKCDVPVKVILVKIKQTYSTFCNFGNLSNIVASKGS